ncbi:NADH-quinone oxidoreductase subunit L [Nitrosomonas sp. Is37]|uniref:NADH-quinone oxidoreductase subunit L n=1 Tax=Nitrosomonas sp. Is37 TaxID=3080535 RepID=UPI00294B19BE|nr:NADH-quinone oxidoreductase subunit L [Nitrosomonas sp. Is37]MDV6344087.1 NADH-quinone oxidoreductase subunit L [Nitrosomonas sp. Is37]
MSQWLWLIPGTPLLGSLIILFLGSLLRRKHLAMVACCASAAAFLVVVLAWLTEATSQPLQQTLYTWVAVGEWRPMFGFTLDRLALVMVSIVSSVGLLVHLYSVPFMAEEADQRRYYFFLNLFLAGMLLLVLADNLLFLYLGWELVGLCSYALIGFWYRDPLPSNAGRKAFIVTRIGDTALALGIFLLFSQFHELSLSALLTSATVQWEKGSTLATLATLLILGGAVGKSAQLPLQVWLPDAMLGPSPVSALIHAATMVTAGVYLIARTHPLFELAPHTQWLVAAIGALTIVYGASAAVAQSDFKKVLAYSTISQIGYMFLALGCGAYTIALFHLTTHAFFKALLFLSAGAVIRASGDEHDINSLGKIGNHPSIARWTFLIGAASLAGVPFITAGFYSKDAILVTAWSAPAGPLLWAFAAFGALLTAIYIFRVYFLVFHGSGPRTSTISLPYFMSLPLLILALLSIVSGFIELPEGWPGPHLWSLWLADELAVATFPPPTITYTLQFITALLPLAGFGLALWLIQREQAYQSLPLANFLRSGWGFDAFYHATLVRPYLALARILQAGESKEGITYIVVRPYRALARGVSDAVETLLIEGALTRITRGFLAFATFCRKGVEYKTLEAGITSLVAALRFSYTILSTTQNGFLSRYALVISTGAVFFLGYWLW